MIKILCLNLDQTLSHHRQDQGAVITAGRSRLLPLPSIPSPVPSLSLHPFSLFARPCVRPSISRSIIALGKLSLSHRHRRPQLALSLAAQTGFLPFLCCSSQFDPMKAIDTLCVGGRIRLCTSFSIRIQCPSINRTSCWFQNIFSLKNM